MKKQQHFGPRHTEILIERGILKPDGTPAMKKPKPVKTEMCPCCGHENPTSLLRCQSCDLVTGQDDPVRHLALWTGCDMPWSSFVTKQPRNWNPLNTLARLALKITQAKTRGRPPRMA